ncbi:MAG: GGDEF domain-containing protein [Acidobacteria bacterium]|nr:GGDEF domain-containing protein [Acidobacteriota bacterium]
MLPKASTAEHHGVSIAPDIPASLLTALNSCRTLPSIPGVVLEVLDLSQDPDIGTAKVAKAISRDPALVAKILKVANSPWCGVRRDVTTLNQAVSLLGVNGTMSLALSFSLIRGLQKAADSHFDHQKYWRRSVISATAAQSIGMCLKSPNQDECFLTGLLQDIGMLVMNEAVPRYGQLVASSGATHRTLIETERRELGTDHAQVGTWFLKKCGLPARLTEAVSESHRKERTSENALGRFALLGSLIAEIWTCPNTAEATKKAAEAAWKQFQLSSDQFSLVLAKTAADLPQITKNLDIPVGDEVFINGLLDQAREAVAELNLRALQEARHFAVQAQCDALTSLYNRTYLNQVLNDQFDVSRSMAQPLTVVFIDIDRFKDINDSHGHSAGDAVLVSVSEAIKSAVRGQDTVARFGGDEFVVLLTDTGEDTGAMIAERIRQMVENFPHLTGNGKKVDVTVSVGWATLSSGSEYSNSTELLGAADRSLYAAKSHGRNRVARDVSRAG